MDSPKAEKVRISSAQKFAHKNCVKRRSELELLWAEDLSIDLTPLFKKLTIKFHEKYFVKKNDAKKKS